MGAAVGWMERHQVILYIVGIVVGAVIGGAAPSLAPGLTVSITPVLGLLLFATFLGVPLTEIGKAVKDVRFLAAVLIVNFVIVPVVAWGLSRFIVGDRALLVGLLLVLLTPCVDYVIVFTGIAGGAKERLLAAAPLLMVLQLALLPVFLFLLAGPGTVSLIDVRPFAEAFVVLIVVPLAAALVQAVARHHRSGIAVESVMQALMVPLMMVTLAVVVGSQISAVGAGIGQLLLVVPLYVAFLIVMLTVGLVAGRIAKLDVPSRRALVFTGSTRNSLVVLPLVLSLPAALSLAPLAVVTQTLIELVGMVVFVRLIPRLIPHRN